MRTAEDDQHLSRFRMLLMLAAAGIAVAAIAGLLLLVLDLAVGSTGEAALGITAAVSGLLTGALTIAALIYAQVKNLWRFFPKEIRIAVWVVLAAALIYGWAQSLS